MQTNLIYKIILPILLIGLAGHAQSADEPPEMTCYEPFSQFEMNQCALKAFELADIELNNEYKKALKAAIEIDGYLSDDLRGAKPALMAAQRAWIKYRDLACTSEGFSYRGGTMEPFLVSACKEDLTRARAERLHHLGE
uniref:Lysozyme inhibitor LprI-like N-terminal domain-containing protein n=1 Tax=OCS116 cluster bacterium TaxID=2030921 RepID=A0A2A4YW05_9PROT